MQRQKAYQPKGGPHVQSWNLSRTMLHLMTVGVLAGAVTLLGCPGGEEQVQPKVAASDVTIPITSTVVRALENQPFTFSSGEALSPALANQPVALTFTNTAVATPTFTVTAPNVRGTDGNPARATGTTGFGSCTFSVASSTFAAGPPPAGPQVGQTITVSLCRVNAATGGIQTGRLSPVEIRMELGLTSSQFRLADIVINSATGEVTLNNVATGQTVTLQVVTGTVGGSP